MTELKPCPFCGGEARTIKFKKDKKKVSGIYYEICFIKCERCTCTISQAGATRERAEENAINVWNRRINNG